MTYLGLNIRKIIKYYLTYRIWNIYYYLRYILPEWKVMRKTKAFKNSKKGREAFVFANGPSIQILNPHKIKKYQDQGFDIFAVNAFIKTEYASIAKPNYYIISDPIWFGIWDRWVTKRAEDTVKSTLPLLEDDDLTFFIPVRYFNKLKAANKYAFCDSENFWSSNTANLLKARGYLSATAYKALAAACYLGYDKIYICGFDNNYFKSITVDEHNRISYRDEHFYKKEEKQNNWQIQDNEGDSLGEVLWYHHLHFKHLEKFKSFPIINLDKEGLVDTFSKKHSLDIYK